MVNSLRDCFAPLRRRAGVNGVGDQPGVLARLGVDLEADHPRPARGKVVYATLAAIAVSLGAVVGLVALATTLFPATRGYSHFQPLDYGSFTVLGVVSACVSWPALVRVAAEPRRLYRRLAVGVSLVLLLPDAYLLLTGQPFRVVGPLVLMHGAVALATYQIVVRLAPAPRRDVPSFVPAATAAGAVAPVAPRRWWFIALGSATCVELAVGFVALLAVPFGRPSEVVVHGRGAVTYLLHGAFGFVLVLAAVALVVAARQAGRSLRAGAIGGLVGIVLGGLGGALVIDRPARLLGIGLMLVGAVLAPTAYFLPLMSEQSPATDALVDAVGDPGLGQTGVEGG